MGDRRPALALLLAVNLALAVAGLLLPFAAVQADSAAPWAAEMQLFAWATSGPCFVAVLTGAGAGVYYFIRGRPEFLFAVSIVALWLPFAVVAGYLWYLFLLLLPTHAVVLTQSVIPSVSGNGSTRRAKFAGLHVRAHR